jgi:hypothetical protein
VLVFRPQTLMKAQEAQNSNVPRTFVCYRFHVRLIGASQHLVHEPTDLF